MTKREIEERMRARLEKQTCSGMHQADYTRVAVEIMFEVAAELLAEKTDGAR